ncbi:MAG: hypothetical protein CMJ31_08930 [Phycisphaerae bacterium]|nr:hypothetical protein [Phycisphaerae bacterium]|tara:strand:+ start:532 stop:1416 length:885 start_codon:yes stop_codon:yes gene_type:complete
MTMQPHNATVGEHRYDNVMDAATGLLGEVAGLTNSLDVPFIVMGGWCPYLRNGLESLPHPGTKDVDLLFKDAATKDGIESVVRTLLAAGFYMSAKHSFQLLRGLRVRKHTLWFNVDLMHPSDSTQRVEFVDHFEFDIPESQTLQGVIKAKSIGIPESAYLFDGHWSDHSVSGTLPSGSLFESTVPLVSPCGLVLSKCRSMMSPKRPRDAFDVYLMLRQADAAITVDHLATLCRRFSSLPDVLAKVCQDMADPEVSYVFNANVKQFCASCLDSDPARFVSEQFNRALGHESGGMS